MKYDQDNMHKGLKDKDMRDLISKGFKRTKGCGHVYCRDIGSLDRFREAFKKAKADLAVAEKQFMYSTLMKEFGWREWYNISDYIPHDELTYQGFIGTEEEADKRFYKKDD